MSDLPAEERLAILEASCRRLLQPATLRMLGIKPERRHDWWCSSRGHRSQGPCDCTMTSQGRSDEDPDD